MVRTEINGRWKLYLPKHRAERPEWGTAEGWERARLDSMATNLGAGDVIIDAGAEEGDMPALYAKWGCDVVMVEPNPRVWPNIRAIFEANDLRDRIVGNYVGFVGDVTRTAKNDAPLAESPHIWPACAFGPVIGDHGFCQLNERPDISRIRIDDLSSELNVRPSALTIDVEGSEYEVLVGAERVMVEDRPLVWCSVHPSFLRDQYGHSYADVLSLVERYGYRYELLDQRHESHYLFIPNEMPYEDGYVVR
jgi:FkbM family methyltransferase